MIIDSSDTTQGSSGSNKKITYGNLFSNVGNMTFSDDAILRSGSTSGDTVNFSTYENDTGTTRTLMQLVSGDIPYLLLSGSANATVNITVNDDLTNYATGTALFTVPLVKSGVTTNHMVLDILDTQDTASFTWGTLEGVFTNSSSAVTVVDLKGVYTQTTDLTKITISLSTGTFSGGTALVYGVN
jgi:hypothetical protein